MGSWLAPSVSELAGRYNGLCPGTLRLNHRRPYAHDPERQPLISLQPHRESAAATLIPLCLPSTATNSLPNALSVKVDCLGIKAGNGLR
jgi:hypothetical protein